MTSLKDKVNDFLSQKTIAVAGVSRDPGGGAANLIYKKLKNSGYTVYPLNPKTDEVEGDRCFSDLRKLPEKVDGVVISTPPEAADDIVKTCADLGIQRVWMHRSFGTGSVSDSAVQFCREHGISVIGGACPMMYCKPVDFGHKCIHWMARVFGQLPD
jgi:predicted CoA-binding protein